MLGAHFFEITPATVKSRFQGGGERAVKALFLAARACQPSVVFIDEIDALMSERGNGDRDAAGIKAEFLL